LLNSCSFHVQYLAEKEPMLEESGLEDDETAVVAVKARAPSTSETIT